MKRRKTTWEVINDDFQSQYFIKVARAYPGELNGDLRHIVWAQAARLEERMTGKHSFMLPRDEE